MKSTMSPEDSDFGFSLGSGFLSGFGFSLGLGLGSGVFPGCADSLGLASGCSLGLASGLALGLDSGLGLTLSLAVGELVAVGVLLFLSALPEQAVNRLPSNAVINKNDIALFFMVSTLLDVGF